MCGEYAQPPSLGSALLMQRPVVCRDRAQRPVTIYIYNYNYNYNYIYIYIHIRIYKHISIRSRRGSGRGKGRGMQGEGEGEGRAELLSPQKFFLFRGNKAQRAAVL